MENKKFSFSERSLFEKLSDLKNKTDDQILSNSHIIENEPYFIRLIQPFVIKTFNEVIFF